MIIKMNYRDDDLFLMADWLAEHAGGPINLQDGSRTGPGWRIYHSTELRKISENPYPLPYLVTKAEIDDPDIATMFKLAWL